MSADPLGAPYHREALLPEPRAGAALREVEWLRAWTASLVSRSGELVAQVDNAVTRSADAQRAAWQTRLRARAMRDWSEALRNSRQQQRSTFDTIGAPVRWFTLTGELGDHAVSAAWVSGRLLTCDPRLLTQAKLLVEVGTVFVNQEPRAEVTATLTGPPAAVMLTLARACDMVFSVDFEAAEEE